MYSFEWDDEKNQINIKKHGVSFDEAKTVFYDEDAWLEYDEAHSSEEERFRLLGCSLMGNILIVVHCIRKGDVLRIISSRKANKNEIKIYKKRKQLGR